MDSVARPDGSQSSNDRLPDIDEMLMSHRSNASRTDADGSLEHTGTASATAKGKKKRNDVPEADQRSSPKRNRQNPAQNAQR